MSEVPHVRTTPSLILRGAVLYGQEAEGAVDIEVRDGVIVAIGAMGELDGEIITDFAGLTAMPGVIDAHTHPIHDETLETVGQVAASGGVTTVLHHLYPKPGEPYPTTVARATDEAKLASSDFGFHVRITPDRASEDLTQLASFSSVVSVKSFLSHADANVMSTTGDLYTIMVNARNAGLPVVAHAELGDVLNRHEATLDRFADLAAFQRARPDYLEAAAVHVAAAIAELAGARLYVAHISNREALEAARAARERGIDITVESCPHYFFVDATAPLGGLGRVTPPLRMPAEIPRMREAIDEGYVDVMASDHCGYGRHEKFVDDVAASSNGLPGIELMLPLLLEAAATESWIDAAGVLRLLCERPAEVFRLSGKGKLAIGFDADIVFFDPAATWTVDGAALHDQSFYSPYDGRELHSRIESVYRRGELTFSRGSEVPASSGRAVTRA